LLFAYLLLSLCLFINPVNLFKILTYHIFVYGQRVTAKLDHFWSRDFGTELCQMIAYDEILITINLQVEPIIGLRDMCEGSK